MEPITFKKKWKDRTPDPSVSNQIDILVKSQTQEKAPQEQLEGEATNSNLIIFHGSAGSGKKVAAWKLGNSLGKDVYRINLSAIISKYIGETEKNLSRIFDAAENKQWILFFDEADALFGKRTEVKDSHDRYANQEVNYLLQHIENYNGLAILSVRTKTNIGEGFLRRIRYIIDFHAPPKNAD